MTEAERGHFEQVVADAVVAFLANLDAWPLIDPDPEAIREQAWAAYVARFLDAAGLRDRVPLPGFDEARAIAARLGAL